MYRREVANIVEMKSEELIDFAINIFQLCPKGSYASFVSDTPYGVYRLNMGLSRRTARVRKMIYNWLLYCYEERLVDASTINAKVFWMLLSDMKHFSGSTLHAAHIFFKTAININLNKVRWVRSNTFGSSIRHRKIEVS
jgi:hypothetical protein